MSYASIRATSLVSAIVMLAAVVGASSCSRLGASAAHDAPFPVDSVRGIIQRVGSEPTAYLSIAMANATRPLPIAANDARVQRALDNTVGLEVLARGHRVVRKTPPSGMQFDVSTFVVRAADGIAAHDGTLERNDGQYYLLTENGQRTLVGALPVALRTQMGARVFIAGPLDKAPQSYGVIAPATP